MSPVCCAFAYAMELSERTFAATAALIGAATLALMSDIAARSGSSSPASAFSSSGLSLRYSSLTRTSSSFAVRRLDRWVERDRRLRGDRRDRRRDQAHHLAIRQPFRLLAFELLRCQVLALPSRL